MPSGSGHSGKGSCVRGCLVLIALASALYVFAPALYWWLKTGIVYAAPSSCAPCICDCPSTPTLSLFGIGPGMANLSFTDCETKDPEFNKEMEKQFVDILAEELRLQIVVSEENMRHMNVTFLETRKISLKYRKEAEKCNAATETCEEAREQAQTLLMEEMKVTSLWEQRARQLGWEGL